MKRFVPVFLTLLYLTSPAAAQSTRRVVIPNVAAFVLGANGSLYGTEVRFYNPTASPKRFVFVDWIGSEGWKPLEYTIPAGGILPVGGWTVFNGDAFVTGESKYGAAVCEIEDGLIVVSRMLQTTVPNQYTGIPGRCSEGTGGANLPYPTPPPGAGCVAGIGPTLEFSRDFFLPGEPMELLVLDDPTVEKNRTNLVIVNPDSRPSTVVVQVHDSVGKLYEKSFEVPGRTYFQISDLYSLPEFKPRLGDFSFGSPSRAMVRCSTRCYAMGYVISNFNNTVSAVAPR